MVGKDFSPDRLPTDAELTKALGLPVWTEEGEQVEFGSLVEGKKSIVIFIRHFQCGVCQDYSTILGQVRKDALEAANTRLVVIGCGDYRAIKEYRELTTFPHELYADPTKELYVTLGMTRRTVHGTPSGEKKKDYVKFSYLTYALKGIVNGPLRNPVGFMRAGDVQQLGGEFVFEPGPKVTFVARMKNTEDHTDVAELMKIAGVELP